jgi:hypothetical protein
MPFNEILRSAQDDTITEVLFPNHALRVGGIAQDENPVLVTFPNTLSAQALSLRMAKLSAFHIPNMLSR